VLHGPENDKTMGMRNWLAMNMARRSGRYASRTQYFELFLQDVSTLMVAVHGVCRQAEGDGAGMCAVEGSLADWGSRYGVRESCRMQMR
jgi:hypothetical protein